MKIIGKILALIAILIALFALLVYFAPQLAAQALTTMGLGALTGLSWTFFAIAAVAIAVLAYVISPEGAGQVFSRVAAGFTAVGKTVGSAAGGLLGGILSGIITGTAGSGIGGLILLGVAAYLGYKYLTKDDDAAAPSKKQVERDTDVSVTQPIVQPTPQLAAA